MNLTSKVLYKGALRTEATHLKSESTIITDAPIDNNGLGSAFSPTDLVATALASCMLTVMGIKARSMGFDLEEASAEIQKIMASGPRRIDEVKITISLTKNCDDATKDLLVKTALSCPVAQSLNDNLTQSISFNWL